jgi:hypothetical protein
LGACEIAGDDEIESADGVPEGLERLAPLGEVFLQDRRDGRASLGAVLGLAPFIKAPL